MEKDIEKPSYYHLDKMSEPHFFEDPIGDLFDMVSVMASRLNKLREQKRSTPLDHMRDRLLDF